MEAVRFSLYKIFIHENRFDIAETAKRIGVSPSLIYKWCEGLSVPSIVHCIQLHYATGDPEFLAMMIAGTDFAIVQRIKGRELSGKDLQAELLENHDSLSRINQSLTKAMNDGRLSRREIARLKELAEANEQKARDVSSIIEALV